MKEKEEKEIDPKDKFVLTALKVCLELGENGEEIVKMINNYIGAGWVDFNRATIILEQIFEKRND